MTKPPELKNRHSQVTGAVALCRECDWCTDSSKNALANASLHARRTGHEVQAQQTVVVTYNRKVDDPHQPTDGSMDKQESEDAQAGK